MALASTIAATAASVGTQALSAQQQRKAQQDRRRMDALEQARQRRETIRAARSARGQALVAAAGQGVNLASSSVQGGQASIQTQQNANLSFLDTSEQIADRATNRLGRANLFDSLSRGFNQIAGTSAAINRGG